MKKRKKRKIILIILGILAVIVLIAVIAIACTMQIYDPNEKLKEYAVEVTAGEDYDAAFDKVPEWLRDNEGMAVFKFTPEESAEYTFRADAMAADKKILMDMYVLDEDLSAMMNVDNYEHEDEDLIIADTVEGNVFLTKGQLYYAIVQVETEEGGDIEGFEKTFTFSVSKAGGDAPEELKAGGKVRLTVNKDNQTCAVFVPEETAFYDFDSNIVSKDAAVGFSSIYGITAEDDTSMVVTDGICFLEAGKTYYVWVGVDETIKKKSRVELSCSRMASESATGICSISIDGKTVIEYTAEADMPLMISSSSDGDPMAVVYDSEGFMLRQDDNSGESVSGNPKDFALGFNAEKGKAYRICVDGKFTQCTVNIQEYKGDGTSPESGAETESSAEDESGEVQDNAGSTEEETGQ